MPDYEYLIPRLHASPWRPVHNRPLYSTLVDAPRVGIYCPHSPHPWLLGSFAKDDEVADATGEDWWAWREEFLTGDGFLILLNRQRNAVTRTTRSLTHLVESEVHDTGALGDQVSRLLEAGDVSKAMELSDYMSNRAHRVRTRISLVCSVCQQPRKFRMTTVQGVLEKLWALGIREVSLDAFASRIHRRG